MERTNTGCEESDSGASKSPLHLAVSEGRLCRCVRVKSVPGASDHEPWCSGERRLPRARPGPGRLRSQAGLPAADLPCSACLPASLPWIMRADEGKCTESLCHGYLVGLSSNIFKIHRKHVILRGLVIDDTQMSNLRIINCDIFKHTSVGIFKHRPAGGKYAGEAWQQH